MTFINQQFRCMKESQFFWKALKFKKFTQLMIEKWESQDEMSDKIVSTINWLWENIFPVNI